MANGYVVPGFYAVIEDYQLSTLETAQSLKEDAIIFFGDLPDFVYVPDEKSTDVNAVKRVRITPNTVLPVTDVNELISTLTGKNILDGILTQEQKDELLCRDMINVIKMSEALALEGKLALVKIVKRDGTRPDINNKFEVFQALENAYEKLGNVKASQIVPIGIAGDDDFISGEEKAPTVAFRQSTADGAVVLDKIYNDIYSFSPVQQRNGIKLEFALEHPEYLDHTKPATENQLIKTEGIDSPKVAHLLTGKVLVAGQPVATGVKLEFVNDQLVALEELKVEVVKAEMSAVIGKGSVFATVKTTLEAGKKVAAIGADGIPAVNYFQREPVLAEIATCDISAKTCKVGEQIKITGTLATLPDEFNTRLEHGDKFTNGGVNIVDFDAPNPTFEVVLTAAKEGTQHIVFTVTAPATEKLYEFDVTVEAGVAAASSRAKKVAEVQPRVQARALQLYSGINQYVLVDIDKPSSNWIEVKNLGNIKEKVDKLAILEGQLDGVEQYAVTKSGTALIETKVLPTGGYEFVVSDPAEMLDPVHYPIETKDNGTDTVVAKTTFLKFGDVTFVAYEGLVVAPKQQPAIASVYFDAKADVVGPARYQVNYVPANSEPIMASLKYVGEQVKTFSEVLMVWGTRPATSAEPSVAEKHVRRLVNLPKFKKGFKVRTSASRETDYGMFLSVVAGTIKMNGVGGISNFAAHRVVDFEREQGGVGAVKPMTNKVFIELTKDFYTGSNVELKTYVGVKQKSVEAVVLSTKEVFGKTMLTLDKEIDTSVFSLDGFEVMLANTDTKDRHGSYAAAAFAIAANKERDRAPIQVDLDGIADFSFSQEALRLLIENKFTVITKNLITGKGTIVDTPLMTRKDSDYQSRSAIGTVLALLNSLRKIANEKKGKRFPKKEDKVMLEEDLRSVFIDELQKNNSLITNYQFATDMRYLDSKGFLSVKFRVQDAKKLETIEFSGGLAKL